MMHTGPQRRAVLPAGLQRALPVMATDLATVMSLVRRTLLSGVGWLAWSAGAAAPPLEPKWVLSQDGAYVIDQKARMAWPRCAEGMPWNGKTCTGKPKLMTHSEAKVHVAARAKADGVAWRLPRAQELRHMLERTSLARGLDPVLFPAAPGEWHWSSTANINMAPVNDYNYGNVMEGRTSANSNRIAFQQGWAVNLSTGQARGDASRSSLLPVRLVRPLD
jgi:Protein of unknown function (DUF1566)